jgi:hypothetical protein
MHGGQKHGVTVAARIARFFERDGLVNQGANAIAHVTAQT